MILEWKSYRAADNAARAMKDRFTKHTLRFMARHGIGVVGVYSNPSDPTMLYYLTQFANDTERQSAWKAFQSDPEWQALRRETEADGPLVAEHTTLVLQPELAAHCATDAIG